MLKGHGRLREVRPDGNKFGPFAYADLNAFPVFIREPLQFTNAIMIWPICYSDTFFRISAPENVSSGRFREIRLTENFKQLSLKLVAVA